MQFNIAMSVSYTHLLTGDWIIKGYKPEHIYAYIRVYSNTLWILFGNLIVHTLNNYIWKPDSYFIVIFVSQPYKLQTHIWKWIAAITA